MEYQENKPRILSNNFGAYGGNVKAFSTSGTYMIEPHDLIYWTTFTFICYISLLHLSPLSASSSKILTYLSLISNAPNTLLLSIPSLSVSLSFSVSLSVFFSFSLPLSFPLSDTFSLSLFLLCLSLSFSLFSFLCPSLSFLSLSLSLSFLSILSLSLFLSIFLSLSLYLCILFSIS